MQSGKLLNSAVAVLSNCNFELRTQKNDNADPALVQLFKQYLACSGNKKKIHLLGMQASPKEIAGYIVLNLSKICHLETSSSD